VFLILFSLSCQSGGTPAGTQTATAPSRPAGTTGSLEVKVSRDNPCSVLHPKEVQEIIGMAVPMREIVDESTCHFHFEPGEASARPPGGAASAGKGDGTSEERKLEDASKTLSGGFAGGEHIIAVTMHWKDGRTAILATRMAGKILGAEMKDAFRKLEGIGDEAWLGPLASTLVFVKGDVGVELDLRMLPDGEARGTRLAKLIASRI
jgi:hypothetical protein